MWLISNDNVLNICCIEGILTWKYFALNISTVDRNAQFNI